MERQIDIWIKQAEATWLEVLHSHAEELFKSTFLPSHDHTHHRRVWNICRDLLKQIAAIKSPVDQSPVDQSLVEGVILAAYFHDLGMVRSMDVEHGELGRDFCRAFFEERKLKPPVRFEEVLKAIEQHDVKDERIYRGIYPGEAPDILSILSIADDLEAMGIIGIYRYAEIYLQRGISLIQLGSSVLENVSVRFNNITRHCKICSGILKRYSQQYKEVVLFYEQYNRQLLVEKEPQKVFSGHIGVVNHICCLSVEGNTDPKEFLQEINKSVSGKLVTDYFTELRNELERARQ